MVKTKIFLGELLLPLSLIFFSIFCLFHHYLITGMWFEPKDFHHEDLVVLLMTLGLVEILRIILAKLLGAKSVDSNKFN